MRPLSIGSSPFERLVVWQRAMDLADRVHVLTRNAAPRFRFALADQMNRSAISIPSNIAEGAGRFSPREFRRFVGIARGPVRELETQLLLGIRVGMVRAGDAAEPLIWAADVGRMLSRLGSSLRRAAEDG